MLVSAPLVAAAAAAAAALLASGADAQTTTNNILENIHAMGSPNDARAYKVTQMAGYTNQYVSDLLSGPGPMTFFCPTDLAFQRLQQQNPAYYSLLTSDAATMQNVLRYHTVPNYVLDTALAPQKFFLPTAYGLNHIRVEMSNQTSSWPSAILFGGNNDSVADIVEVRRNFTSIVHTEKSSNGVLHLLDHILSPPKTFAEVVATRNLTSMVAALNEAQIDISTMSNFTLFAPRDDAFVNLNTFLTANNLSLTTGQFLKSLLSFHIVPSGQYFSSNFLTDITAYLATNLTNEEIRFDAHPSGINFYGAGQTGLKLMIPARLAEPDVFVQNGVMHVLEGAIIPNITAAIAGGNVVAPPYPANATNAIPPNSVRPGGPPPGNGSGSTDGGGGGSAGTGVTAAKSGAATAESRLLTMSPASGGLAAAAAVVAVVLALA
ncbi:hypothetical protein HDU87_000116 [Geranomyces variabilis]|uniref:FAS1 domain-containing protein n=1 Tax=Geranomyces variabilis TaxID=109894 RepID=A0AAD5TS25_9FUNG|nr:hypothetical protein HDU87_000116 [Geranomyces variabilis]